MIDDTLAGGNTDGYAFSLTDYSGSPVDHFRAVAAPVNADLGLRAFCADESGVLPYADDGRASTCLRAGEPLPSSSAGHLCPDDGTQFLHDFKRHPPRLLGLGHIERNSPHPGVSAAAVALADLSQIHGRLARRPGI
jgi:hypothetical protein